MPIPYKKKAPQYKGSTCRNCKTLITPSISHSNYCLDCNLKWADQIRALRERERQQILDTFEPFKI